jgi:hypothetical protein
VSRPLYPYAKQCPAAAGELEQIQLLLGHASVQTAEMYLGTKQDLIHPPNDAIKLKVVVLAKLHRLSFTPVQLLVSFGEICKKVRQSDCKLPQCRGPHSGASFDR